MNKNLETALIEQWRKKWIGTVAATEFEVTRALKYLEREPHNTVELEQLVQLLREKDIQDAIDNGIGA